MGFLLSILMPLLTLINHLTFYGRSSKAKLTPILLLFPTSHNIINYEGNGLNGSTKVNLGLIDDLKKLNANIELGTISKTFFAGIFDIFYEKRLRDLVTCSEKIIVSVPGSSGLISAYLSFFCRKKVVFLSHNAEYLHRREWRRNLTSNYRKVQYYLKGLKGLLADFLVANTASKILVLSETEIEIYWKRLRKLSKRNIFFYFPYVPPTKFFFKPRNAKVSKLKKENVAIIGTFSESIGEYRETKKFLDSSSSIKTSINRKKMNLISLGNGVRYSFCDKNLGYLSDKEFLSMQESIESIIIPTDWGWGFKTKISDAIFLGQRVFVPLEISKRYPSWVEALEVVVDWSEFRYKDDSVKKANLRKIVMEKQKKIRRNLLDDIVR